MVKLSTLANKQVIVTVGNEPTLFSYDTPICTKKVNGQIVLYLNWDYSNTTSKYRKIFLNGETTKETRAKLASGEYTIKGYYI